jgi:alpha-mannosidase
VTEPTTIRRNRAELLRQLIGHARRGPTQPVEVTAHHVGGEPITWAEAVGRPYEPFAVGGRWGPAWDTTWFRVRGTVPAGWSGRTVSLVVRLGYTGGPGFGPEGMVWRDGEPAQGITPNHDDFVLAEAAAGGEVVDLYIEAAANPPIAQVEPRQMYLPDYAGSAAWSLAACHLTVVDREVDALWEDWSLLLELYGRRPPESARAAQILRGLDRAGALLDPDDVRGTAAAARAELAPLLAKPAHASAHRYAAVGNAHIDSAWLWPLRETRRKVARTFSTAVDLMGRYPEYRFAASQAQQLAWVRDDYPGLFERIRKKVADGQFEVVGSMWVEADCNVPSGESLVRQISHGKRFFREELGTDTTSLWLPDVFGYPANLPQILALSGIRWFLTQKISWNQVNHFPHHTFWWEGIDGTRLLSHFPPADTYVGDVSLGQLDHGARNFAQKALTDRSMYLYGWGDGGGGPTRHMLERIRRLGDLEGAPRMEPMGATEAFEAIEAEVPLDELPVWAGELYLEMHRGTYTTHAEVKKANRRIELALRDVELWSVLAEAATGRPYPADQLDQAWKLLLLHQFHDIIPGSSIHWVYQDTARDHAALLDLTGTLADEALRELAASAVPPDAAADAVLVANPLSVPRCEVVEVAGAPAIVSAPACGWRVQQPHQDPELAGWAPVQSGPGWMDNGILRVEWDGDGLLTSLFHHATGRQALAPGARGNLLQVHADRPVEYEAWDIDAVAYQRAVDLTAAEEVSALGSGPLRAGFLVRRRFRSSTIEQRITLRAGAPTVEIHTVADWRDPMHVLKAAFPVQVHSRHASYEVQFGHLERPTHANTSWDEARFEVCAHTWADLAEGSFGVALLNDCKYGYDIQGNVVRLTLLRSPTWPDPVADQGRHELTYALMPHGAGDPVTAGVVAAAHALNSPLRVVEAAAPGAGSLPPTFSAVEVDDPAAVVTAVKRPDADGEGIVVRLYEAGASHRRVRVRCSVPGLSTVSRIDLLERPMDPPIEVADDGAAWVALHPFEIVTLLFS